MKNKLTAGRDVMMLEANVEDAPKNEYGKVLKFIPKTDLSVCDRVQVKWENGKTTECPAHWIGTFSCDDVADLKGEGKE